jgi:predicted alpha/beta-fold hydrolase
MLADSLPRAEREAQENNRSMPFQIVRAIAVAPPIDLNASCANVERGLNRIYARYFVRALRKQSRERAAIWDAWRDRLRHADFSSIRRFDETMTVHLAGFRDLEDYYTSGSSRDILHRITVPTTLLIDEHDPIVPQSLFDGVRYSECTELIRTQFGGHVGYLCRNSGNEAMATGGRYHRWADAWIVRALAAPVGQNTPQLGSTTMDA